MSWFRFFLKVSFQCPVLNRGGDGSRRGLNVEEDFLAVARRKRDERERDRQQRDEELARLAAGVGRRSAQSSPATSTGTSPRYSGNRESLVMVTVASSSNDDCDSGGGSTDDESSNGSVATRDDPFVPPARRVSKAELPEQESFSSSSTGGSGLHLSATGTRPARRLSRSDVVPQLRLSQSELALKTPAASLDSSQTRAASLSQPLMLPPEPRRLRERSQSISGHPQEEAAGSVGSLSARGSKKSTLTRSLSTRMRRIASPAGDLVSESNSTGSWLAPRQASPRNKRSGPSSPRKVVSPRKASATARWPRGSGGGAGAAQTLVKISGVVMMLNSAQKWSKRWCRICDNTLEVFHRDKVSGKPAATPKRLVNLGGGLIRAETEKQVMGKQHVLEIVSMSDGPAVMAFASGPELLKWTTIAQDAAANKEATAAFPGIRMIEVQEEKDDETWKSLVARTDGWRVELASTPVDVTFAASSKDHSEYGRYFGEQPHSAWVGIGGADGEVFVALIAHADDYSRMLVRTGLNDRLIEFVSTKNDARLLRRLDHVELYPVADPSCLRDLDAIGAQNMSEFTAFKFGVLFTKKDWTEQQMFENCTVSPDFDEFLEMLGSRVTLEGFKRYAGGLDVEPGGAARSGEHGLFVEYRECEIMLHVCNWIPLTREQTNRTVQRKRHIANDFCVIVFCDDGDGPFLPSLVKTKMVHVYIVVTKDRKLSQTMGRAQYRVATVLRSGMPSFGPRLVRPPVYERGPAFRDFLMAKCINGEKASKFAPDFLRQRADLRGWFLQKLFDDSKRGK